MILRDFPSKNGLSKSHLNSRFGFLDSKGRRDLSLQRSIHSPTMEVMEITLNERKLHETTIGDIPFSTEP